MFRRRFVRKGPWVPVKIEMVQPVNEAGELIADEYQIATVGGRDDQFTYRRPELIWSVWLAVARHPISESEYFALLASAQPGWFAPAEQPREPIRP